MDPEAIENTLSHTAEGSEGPNNTKHDEKTDELVISLETSVDKAFTSIQDSTVSGITKIQGLVSEKLPDFQKQWNETKLPQLPDVKVNDTVNKITKDLKLDEYVKKEDIERLKQRGGEFLSKAGENTTKVLDDIDEDLEKLENMTIDYAQQLGSQIGSFFKTQLNTINEKADVKTESQTESTSSTWSWPAWGKQLTELVTGNSPESVISNEKKMELLFSLPKGISPGTRAESQVHELQSDPSIYTGAIESCEFKDYKLTDEQKAEASELLQNTSLHLIEVYNKVINTKEDDDEQKKITDEDFWKVYFGKKQQIMDDEQKRKALLEKSKTVKEDDDEEDFDWDE